MTLTPVKCPNCGKLICEASGVVKKRCERCKKIFTYDTNKKKYVSEPSVPFTD